MPASTISPSGWTSRQEGVPLSDELLAMPWLPKVRIEGAVGVVAGHAIEAAACDRPASAHHDVETARLGLDGHGGDARNCAADVVERRAVGRARIVVADDGVRRRGGIDGDDASVGLDGDARVRARIAGNAARGRAAGTELRVQPAGHVVFEHGVVGVSRVPAVSVAVTWIK